MPLVNGLCVWCLERGLSVGLLVGRTSRGVLRHPFHPHLRPDSEGMQEVGPGICRGTSEEEDVSIICARQTMRGVHPSLSAGCLSDH